MTTKKLTDLLTPQAHQCLINRLVARLNPATPVLNQNILHKIEWHTNQYLSKTGQLPE